MAGYHCDTTIINRLGGVNQLLKKQNDKISLQEPEELIFDGIDTLKVKVAIDKSLNASKLFADDIQVSCVNYENIGADFCSQFRVSADAICQLAIQASYMKVHGVEKPGSVYKTATSRRYYHGRTETIRSCSKAVVMFCRELVEHGDLNSAKLWQYFKDAMIEHVKLTSTCSRGKGADRHLLMLQTIAAKQGFTPEFFKDPMWKLSGGDAQFTLSTSYTGPFGEVGACAPMKKGGYGIFYCSDTNAILFSITSFASDFPLTDGKAMANSIEWALEAIKCLIVGWSTDDSKYQPAKL